LSLLGPETDAGYELLVAEHISQRGQGLGDIATGLLDGLDRARGKVRRFKLDLQFDLKVVKGQIQKADEPHDVVVAFIDAVEQAWDRSKDWVNGILLVIDEIDRVADAPGMATFFKVATEMMSSRGLENVMLLPVGMVGVKELLKAEHESVGRVFETIELPLLTVDECMDIVTRALESSGVAIVEEVNERITAFASGFPHPVHLLGSEAFRSDIDDVIAFDDLESAIQAVVTERWKDEFDANFIYAGSGNNRDIIKTMASCPENDVPLQYICDQLGRSQPQISSNINTLMKRDVIVRTDRGLYRFKEPLFRIYVQHLNVFGAEPVEHRPRRRRPSRRPPHDMQIQT
jgi:hypothetical protein